MASTTGWIGSTETGAIGNDQSLNNDSGFNAFPEGYSNAFGSTGDEGFSAFFWSSTENNTGNAFSRNLSNLYSYLNRGNNGKRFGFSVRFVKD